MRNFQLFTISVIFFKNITPLFEIIIVLLQVYLPIYICSMAKKDVNRLKIMLAVTKHSNKWLAEMLGKDQATISKWCTNTCQPDLETLIRISDLLGGGVLRLVEDDYGVAQCASAHEGKWSYLYDMLFHHVLQFYGRYHVF